MSSATAYLAALRPIDPLRAAIEVVEAGETLDIVAVEAQLLRRHDQLTAFAAEHPAALEQVRDLIELCKALIPPLRQLATGDIRSFNEGVTAALSAYLEERP